MKKIFGIVLIVGGIFPFIYTLIDGYRNGFMRSEFGMGVPGSLCIMVLGIFLYLNALKSLAMTENNLKGFYQTYYSIFETVDDCIKQGRVVPALILIYSAIDGFSDLANNNCQGTRKVFTSWVKKWMLTNYPLPCNEIDLYSARCSLLHLQNSESDLVKKGEAKELVYVWGVSETPKFQFGIDALGKRAIAIKVEDIYWSFRKGMVDCLNAIESDPGWKSSFEEKASKLFSKIGS